MNNILKLGVYRIGSTSPSVVRKLQDIVSLKLNATDRKVTKRHYSFVELQDLESKLVLITGSKAKNRNEVDLFLDVRIIILYSITLVCHYKANCILTYSVLLRTVPIIHCSYHKKLHIFKSLYSHLNKRYGLTMVMKWKNNSSTSEILENKPQIVN
jgi:hypothetical protein